MSTLSFIAKFTSNIYFYFITDPLDLYRDIDITHYRDIFSSLFLLETLVVLDNILIFKADNIRVEDNRLNLFHSYFILFYFLGLGLGFSMMLYMTVSLMLYYVV